MISKINILLIGFSFSTLVTKAQITYNFSVGANNTKWQGNDVQVIKDLVSKAEGYIVTKPKTGLTINSFVNIPINNIFSVQTGLGYSKKGYSLMGDLKINALKYLGFNAGLKVQSHYIDLPIYVKANVVKGLNIYAGPEFSYLVRSTLNFKAGILGFSLINKGVGITSRLHKTDVGLSGGLGYDFNKGLTVALGYNYGLRKLDKNNDYDVYNRSANISMGIRF